ncbi:hypothetical protein THARTR1_08713 [Trichoderma harzianum]|uniref:Carbonic anhydrase n=1 Tax=Trichoderma harzianum TaxID=5544 RepID=A0A2K0TYV5_TRIHA|nr:hypothetical protein THARTR1_08713 [Trichoderma harzianum]
MICSTILVDSSALANFGTIESLTATWRKRRHGRNMLRPTRPSRPVLGWIRNDEARNAGGRASEALRAIICVDHVLGVGAVIVIHHTDCGLTHLRNDFLHKSLTEKAPNNAAEIAKMDFLEILDLKASVIEDMKILENSPYLRKDLKVYGYVYDIKTGKLQDVKG